MNDTDKNLAERLLKPYDPAETEGRIYATWEASGLFNPDECVRQGVAAIDAEVFSIVLPPPNVTGTLHMGSTLMLAIEDIMVRYNRMLGKRTLWLPGSDHAAIATQSKVEKLLQKEEGKRKEDLGREAFLERVAAFASANHDYMIDQMKKVGSSLDWSREAYTLDKPRARAVYTAFKKMYDDGLIYRKYRIVNWDPKGQTVISDDEIVHEERTATLYTFRYSKDFPIPISTTRPETKVGDTAVAVHPDDPRYQAYIGQTFEVSFAHMPLTIRIIADPSVDPEFGTGALGVTPAHSMIDWDMAERHNLPMIPVIDERARMTAAGELNGKKTAEAREAIAAWLSEEGLLEKTEEIKQNVSTAERTGGIIEPLPKLQWFVDVNKPFAVTRSSIDGIAAGGTATLKEIMLAAVRNRQITILPERFNKTYFSWIENLRDWCISRQIWFGHRIPVWYRGDEAYCDSEAPEGEGWEQDSDTLDTWFSSALWTFSTLGWPDETDDLRTYHPTSVVETGYDIIFFWVARMILMSGYFLGEVPFKTVYLHGLVRDAKGQKISKSLGNNIDPIEMAERYGADAVRMSLIVGTGPGNDSRMSEDKLKAYKHFANKIWNVSRFVLSNLDDPAAAPAEAAFDAKDEADIAEWKQALADITTDMDNYRFYLAAEKLYHYFWHIFADRIIEESKDRLKDFATRPGTQRKLFQILSETLRALHPFMPFITEELWSMVPVHEKRLLMIEKWPV
jgi:valyl-tRNA synthetase